MFNKLFKKIFGNKQTLVHKPLNLDAEMSISFDDFNFEKTDEIEEILKPKTSGLSVIAEHSKERHIIFQAVIIDTIERGISYDDSDLHIDSNPDRMECIIRTLNCDFNDFIKAFDKTSEGQNFCYCNQNKLIDIGGSSLLLEKGSYITIYSDYTVNN